RGDGFRVLLLGSHGQARTLREPDGARAAVSCRRLGDRSRAASPRPAGTRRCGMKSLVIAVTHVMIVASLGGKLLLDRAIRPRIWARTSPVDPNLPIRGRYVRLRIEATPAPDLGASGGDAIPVALSAEDGRLIATRAGDNATLTARVSRRAGAPS